MLKAESNGVLKVSFLSASYVFLDNSRQVGFSLYSSIVDGKHASQMNDVSQLQMISVIY